MKVLPQPRRHLKWDPELLQADFGEKWGSNSDTYSWRLYLQATLTKGLR
jgi:hypothetical protein